MDNLTHLVCVNNITTYAKGFVPMSTCNNMGCCSLTNFSLILICSRVVIVLLLFIKPPDETLKTKAIIGPDF